MELVRKVNSNYNQVNLQLKILGDEGIISDNRIGRLRLISLNRENSKTLTILKALVVLKIGEARLRNKT